MHAHYSTTGKAFPRCGKCKAVQYCSPECQRRDWKAGRYSHRAICDILNELSRFATFDRTVMSMDEFATACEKHAFPRERAILLAKWMCAATGATTDDIPAPYKELLTGHIGIPSLR
ncbi:hypothetical protein EXIGLDRAFT_502719 [Exidia glandulosa HHB12029]|uniref:MYND-type domain-containing protein n=1 Tax=Exidia glandulosa HHB12029 TaxID=1314781 RepID=A0A166N6Y0_EXIGL|nr:hypothetical protein EXIGLDRAFT_502719 [Exidia glandulosa HHB12029]